MTDKHGFSIDNPGNRAIEAQIVVAWPDKSIADSPAAETIRHSQHCHPTNILEECKRGRIAELNDQARATIETTSCVISIGFMELDHAYRATVYRAVSQNDAWTVANAFDADRNFGILFKLANGAWMQATPDSEAIAHIVIWTIDCLDHSLEPMSARPRDPSATVRVISLMLANKY